VATIGLSAFLLFIIQLLAGRLVLPVFGGSPGVWTTALMLFTGLLFVGYLYAHFVATRLDARRGGLLHLAVAGVVVLLAAFAPGNVATLRLLGTPEVLNVLYALAVIAGAPVFLLAATTPLLSAWFARSGRDPWWLYAVSNGASFIGLLGYPLIIERSLPLSSQRLLVLGGLLAYAALVGLLTAISWSAGRGRQASVERAEAGAVAGTDLDQEAVRPPALSRQARWLLAAAIPAGLLSATTGFMATDLVSMPLLWAAPLALYLLSFVVAFSARGRRTLRGVEVLVPAAATLLWLPAVLPLGVQPQVLLPIVLASFFVLATAVHGRLALDRPDPRQLTRFYLILAAGGALATTFVALIAPIVFNSIGEYPLLIVAAIGVMALLPGPRAGAAQAEVAEPSRRPKRGRPDAGRTADERELPARLRRWTRAAALHLVPYAAAAALIMLAIERGGSLPVAAALVVAGGLVIAVGRTPGVLAAGTALALVVLLFWASPADVLRVRDFFGVTAVRQMPGPSNALYSGTTLHGLQVTGDDRRFQPTTYYVRDGPLGEIFDELRTRTSSASIGVVGLGAGTIAAYALPGDELTFFEIDPAVVSLAQDDRYFTYLRDAPARAQIRLGDGRLGLEAESNARFDLLILDAFSSDAIPAHLLTAEAMSLYRDRLSPDGIIAFHLSNRFYRLAGPTGATARDVGLLARVREYDPSDAQVSLYGAHSSIWLVAGSEAATRPFTDLGWRAAPGGPVLSDDFFDVLRMLF
jgi:hypothetical protein